MTDRMTDLNPWDIWRAVARMDDRTRRFWSKVDVRGEDECWEWQGYRNNGGYGMFVYDLADRKRIGAHRVALWLQGVEQGDFYVLHSCDNPPCCNPAHLRLGTHQENMADAGRARRKRIGLGLTEDHIRLFRACRGHVPRLALCELFGVSRAHVSAIQRGKAWADVV